jgi:P27 family predicted phage terminase small subunit
MRGRKPVPAETRERAGEGRRRIPTVIGGRVRPDKPANLTRDASATWDTIVDTLTKADVIDAADAGVLEAAAIFWGRAREARREMKGQPLLVQTPQGPVPNRLLTIERDSWKEFRALAESLPLSPWGRARLGLKAKLPVDQVEADIGLPPRLRALKEEAS